jgi:phthalate 4,5-dioxygenase oxygenase subunit
MLTQADNETLTQVGPGTPAGELYRRFWIPVSTSGRIGGPDGPQRRLRILGENLIAFRDSDGKVGVLQAQCPHRRAQLFWGRNEEGGLRCAYHGWKFDVTGQCVDMPTEPPESKYKDRLKTIGYPAVERGGLVWIYMGPADRQPVLPEHEFMDLPDTHRIAMSWLQESNYLQALEGDVDTAHVSYLHRWLDPDTAPTAIQMIKGYRHIVGQDKSPKLTVRQTDYGFLYGGRRTLDDGRYYWRITQWLAPFSTHTPTTERGLIKINVPIDDNYTLSIQVNWNPDKPLPNDEEAVRRRAMDGEEGKTILTGGHVIDHPRGPFNTDNDFGLDRDRQGLKFSGIQGGTVAEDRAVSETMGAVLDRGEEHLGISDIAIVALRRSLLRMIRALGDGTEPRLATDGELYRVRGVDVISDEPDFSKLVDLYQERLYNQAAGAL